MLMHLLLKAVSLVKRELGLGSQYKTEMNNMKTCFVNCRLNTRRLKMSITMFMY